MGGMAMVQEVRDALQSLSKAKPSTPTVAWASAFGEAGTNGTVPLYLASACGQIYVQPSGMVSFNGLESVGFFIRGLLDRIKVMLDKSHNKTCRILMIRSNHTY